MVLNSPPRNQQQALFERSFRRVIVKVWHLACDRDHRFLHHVLGVTVGETAFPRYVVNQPPVGVEKKAPTVGITQVTQPAQKRAARWQTVLGSRSTQSARPAADCYRVWVIQRIRVWHNCPIKESAISGGAGLFPLQTGHDSRPL